MLVTVLTVSFTLSSSVKSTCIVLFSDILGIVTVLSTYPALLTTIVTLEPSGTSEIFPTVPLIVQLSKDKLELTITLYVVV